MTLVVCLLYLTLVTPAVSGANILVAAGVQGSHLYSAVNTAEILAEQGHNVTLFPCGKETRVDVATGKKYNFFQPPEFVLYDMDNLKKFEEIILAMFESRSEDLAFNMVALNDEVLEFQIREFKRITKAYDHPIIEDLFLNWGFDLIILEQTIVNAVVTKLEMMKLKIPTVVIYAGYSVMDIRSAENMPSLVNSEHNMLNDVSDGKPDFYGRFETVRKMFKFVGFILRFAEISTEYDVSLETIMSRHEMNFGIGHPALSFPSLAPANFKYLGFFAMKNHVPKPLPDAMVKFMDGCGDLNIIYMSFGTFLPDPKNIPWIKDFFDHLMKANICVIFKAYPDLMEQLSLPKDRVYIQYWMPQKDILSNHKIKFFLSHCGNNGRLEAIFFNVPILCLPLFAEQYQNSLLVKMKEFGSVIKRESVIEKGESFVVDVINDMINNHDKYKTNMAVAKEIVQNDPGSGINVFLYHINLILKHGNARHLKNDLLLQQSMVEAYNLDILAVGLLIVIMLLVTVVFIVIKIIKSCYRVLLKKPKTE